VPVAFFLHARVAIFVQRAEFRTPCSLRARSASAGVAMRAEPVLIGDDPQPQVRWTLDDAALQRLRELLRWQ
jgi:hypothetical protein